MITVSRESWNGSAGEASANVPDYRKLIIEMVQNIDESENKFLIQVYTIIHRHMEKRGR